MSAGDLPSGNPSGSETLAEHRVGRFRRYLPQMCLWREIWWLAGKVPLDLPRNPVKNWPKIPRIPILGLGSRKGFW